jgi:hypothetical protein
MGPSFSKRVVVVDPGHGHGSGHHAELNHQLVNSGRTAGLELECWVDQALPAQDPAYRPVLDGCGYVDPRHWLDLAGSLHLARRLHNQLSAQLAPHLAAPPVGCWIAHSMLPFQLIGLAQLLQHQPPGEVRIGILYAPGERLGGSSEATAISPGPERERSLAVANAQLAWSGMARAVHQAGHRLRISCSSQLQADLHAPLLAAAGLPPPLLQPAVVGAGWRPHGSGRREASSAGAGPLVLLHWGDLRPDKGRQEVLMLLEALLAGAAQELPRCRWLFHHCSSASLSAAETALLQRAQAQLPGFQLWEGATSHEAMQSTLASTRLALLPYCPLAYAERSSGVLWCYGAARLAVAEPAHAVGYSGSWLEVEARALGIGWQSLNGPAMGASPHSAQAWLLAIEQALAASSSTFSAYGHQVLGPSYAQWLWAGLHSPP